MLDANQPLRKMTRELGIARALRASVGDQNYRLMKSLARGLNRTARERLGMVARRESERALQQVNPDLTKSTVLCLPLEGKMPEQIRLENLERVAEIFNAASVDWFLIRNDSKTRWTVGVFEESRSRVNELLASGLHDEAVYVTDATPGTMDRRMILARDLVTDDSLGAVSALRLASFYRDEDTGFRIGMGYSCDLEFWAREANEPTTLIAPRRNVAAQVITESEFKPAVTTIAGKKFPTLQIFKERMLDDIAFPIDAVYTWVDGDDPEWIESKKQLEAKLLGVEYHAEANHLARFRSRDELRYSLRSLEMYAPWFNRVYLVTNGQVPAWLRTDHPNLTIVSHDQIYDDSSCLPNFNSNSIISRLHHIPGLSEHYVYINDDVFFGRAVTPDQFFLPSGIARVSVSNNRRPFGDPDVADEPHFNLTRNMRNLVKEDFGVTISRAMKHTPHPQILSVHHEMEERFKDQYRQTWSSHFRHHSDIVADQLFHYYAQIVGKAVPAHLRYNYINILDDSYESAMCSMLRYRDRDTFCLNDAPVEGATPIEDDKVNDFLNRYFPVASSFEL